MVRLLWPEVRQSSRAWLSLRITGGRVLRNFGDELAPHLFEAATGESLRWAPPSHAAIITVGSIIDLYAYHAQGASVWGAGLRRLPASPGEGRALRARLGRCYAVRGPLTREALGLSDECILGDPGILAPEILQGEVPLPTGRPLVIPHYRAWGSRQGRVVIKEFMRAGFDVVGPNQDPVNIVRHIRNASAVFGSSLHAIIVADAFGVPASLTTFAEKAPLGEPNFKYRDYFQSVGAMPEWLSWRDVIYDYDGAVESIRTVSDIRFNALVALREGLKTSARSVLTGAESEQ
ncbi:polysaccharide pyruvyl transferase family protein [Microbacterium sp. SYP-A9085]|uniref:polysaccharide pyruvyl transferase family protein n=1 Tax=Microbacterium sp. SYP-A9085 TaxID=2664454 RepID=UPI0020A6818F|nr:polysaccharide pyruvyl transferase family protein [Microbacterium sp. SYP-A9085]